MNPQKMSGGSAGLEGYNHIPQTILQIRVYECGGGEGPLNYISMP